MRKKFKKIILFCLLAAIFIAGAPYSYCEGFRYDPHARRDPFVPLAGGQKAAVTKLEDITSVEDVKLEGIAIGAQGKRVAMLNGEMLKENDKVGEVEIMKIEKKSITILMGGKPHNLYLPGEEGGAKGEK